jgi:hypothetical protein
MARLDYLLSFAGKPEFANQSVRIYRKISPKAEHVRYMYLLLLFAPHFGLSFREADCHPKFFYMHRRELLRPRYLSLFHSARAGPNP